MAAFMGTVKLESAEFRVCRPVGQALSSVSGE